MQIKSRMGLKSFTIILNWKLFWNVLQRQKWLSCMLVPERINVFCLCYIISDLRGPIDQIHNIFFSQKSITFLGNYSIFQPFFDRLWWFFSAIMFVFGNILCEKASYPIRLSYSFMNYLPFVHFLKHGFVHTVY